MDTPPNTNVADTAWDRVVAVYGDWEKVRRLVEGGENVNAVGRVWTATALHYAAVFGSEEICEFLLSRGANVSQTDEDGDGPLHVAALYHRADICQLLVDHKADVTSVNNEGETPLLLAADWYDSPAVCRPLITHDSVNVADRHGNTALHVAARNGNIETVQLLVDCGAHTNAVNEDEQTPLHTAAGGEEDCPELCSILLEHDAKINVVDKDGDQPLHLACKKGNTATANLLLSCGADVTASNEGQRRYLELANEFKLMSAQDHDETQQVKSAREQVEDVKPIATLEVIVSPDGGLYRSGSLSVFVPNGAVSEAVNIKMHLYVDKRLMPSHTTANDGYILSPLLVFEPHGLTFLKHVQVSFPLPVDSEGWHLSLMRVMSDTSTSSQLWKPKAIVTVDSDVSQVNVIDVDCEYDLVKGILSIKHFCWHWWFGKPVDMFMASKTMHFSVFGNRQRPTVNTWNLTIHCHDDCHELIERMKANETGVSPSRDALCFNRPMKMKFEGDINISITRGNWKATPKLQSVAAAEFWSKWICLDKPFDFIVEFEHDDNPTSNYCYVDIEQGDQTNSILISPCLVQDVKRPETDNTVLNAPLSTGCKADDRVTRKELSALAKLIEGCWEEFAVTLAPDQFQVLGNVAAIKSLLRSPELQARAMLDAWSDNLGVRAHRCFLIEALIKRRLRSQADEVFGTELVEQVSPQ